MRVVVTRPKEQAAPLAGRLEALGHEVVVCPLIETEPLGDDPIDLHPYDWVVVTSVNGARELARRARGEPKRLAAIGPGTAEALRAEGFDPELVPATATQEGLAAELPRPAGRVLIAAAEAARRYLVDELEAEFLPLYRTRELRPPNPPSGDLVVLGSASAARALAGLPVEIPAVSIGPETTRVARELGIDVVAEADPHTLEGLVAAVSKAGAERQEA
jgi:uroporphyrinogen III methyltransferase/synthase